MRDKQERVKEKCDKRRGAERVFRVGDRVYVKTVRGEHVSWQEAVVTQVVSAVTYVVKVHNQFRFVHADHLRPSHADTSTRAYDVERPEQRIGPAEPAPSTPPVPSDTDHETAALSQPVPRPSESEPNDHAAVEPPTALEAPAHPEVTSPPTTVPSSPKSTDNQAPRRSTRVRKPPDRFEHEDFRK
ncbi:uncharacterized protein LOC119459305 [Dermacentor silvarum]|uniref:uncharacterized protein LOC119459305 n=1 Tax=Dermacentor silvarum TaxID=543639 RepID=UPI00189BBA74|nr:uncharacterized protein LOC119459305 [Dermacentor silvarum]